MKSAQLSIAVLCLLGCVSSENLALLKNGKVKRTIQYRTYGLTQLRDHNNDTQDIIADLEPTYLQIKDHENDTEDLIPDNEVNYVQTNDHENDTEDIPENMEPLNVHLRDSDGGWLSPDQMAKAERKKTDQKWDQLYEQEDDESSFEYVQTRDHINDTDDIPFGQEPLGFDSMIQLSYNKTHPRENDTDDIVHTFNPEGWQNHAQGHKLDFGFTGKRIGELIQMDDDDDEFDGQDVVLMRYTVGHHDKDTDDVVVELNPENYDHKHSKAWNTMVNEKAVELEQQMKLEETMEKRKAQMLVEQKKRAEEVARNDAEERRRMEELKRNPGKAITIAEKKEVDPMKTVDLKEVYGSIDPSDYSNAQDKEYLV